VGTQHPDILGVSAVDEEFLILYSNGFQHYIEGDWRKAKHILRSCEVRPPTALSALHDRAKGEGDTAERHIQEESCMVRLGGGVSTS
jgi:hypothetical protein